MKTSLLCTRGAAPVAAFLALTAASFAATSSQPSQYSSPATPTGTEARNNSKDSGSPDMNSPTTPRSAKWRTVFLNPGSRDANSLASDDRLYAQPNGQVFTKDGSHVGHLTAPDGTPIRLMPASDDFQIRNQSGDLVGAHRPGPGVDSSRTVLLHEHQ